MMFPRLGHVGAMVLIGLAGCQQIPKSANPIRAEDYLAAAETSERAITLRPVGVRTTGPKYFLAPPSPLKLDLVIQYPKTIGKWELDCRHALYDDPEQCVEIIGPDGTRVSVVTEAERATKRKFPLARHWGHPILFAIDVDGEHARGIIPCTIEVKERLSPGAYRVRLLPTLTTSWLDSRFRAQLSIDESWHTFEIRVAEIAPPERPSQAHSGAAAPSHAAASESAVTSPPSSS